jgi:hypothetical protein
MIEQPIAQPQAGDIMLLRGHRQHVRVVYVGSRFARIHFGRIPSGGPAFGELFTTLP